MLTEKQVIIFFPKCLVIKSAHNAGFQAVQNFKGNKSHIDLVHSTKCSYILCPWLISSKAIRKFVNYIFLRQFFNILLFLHLASSFFNKCTGASLPKAMILSLSTMQMVLDTVCVFHSCIYNKCFNRRVIFAQCH